MPTPVDMEIDKPGEEHGGVKHTSSEEGATKIQSPPHVKRANKDIEPTPERKDDAGDEDGTNHVTPAKEEQRSARENKDPKRTKMQTLDAFFGKLKENKEELREHNSVTEVTGYRTKGGRKLVPVGTQRKQRKERARTSRKEGAEADGLEEAEKTISFGTNDSNNKAAAPFKSARRKGIKEKNQDI